MTRSMFDVGVKRRLDELEVALIAPDPEDIRQLLHSHATAFITLGTSQHLPGFVAIAQTVLRLLDQQPEQVIRVAHLALSDWQQAYQAVQAGDRSQGGQVSPELQALLADPLPALPEAEALSTAAEENPLGFLAWDSTAQEPELPPPDPETLLPAFLGTETPADPAVPTAESFWEEVETQVFPSTDWPDLEIPPITSLEELEPPEAELSTPPLVENFWADLDTPPPAFTSPDPGPAEVFASSDLDIPAEDPDLSTLLPGKDFETEATDPPPATSPADPLVALIWGELTDIADLSSLGSDILRPDPETLWRPAAELLPELQDPEETEIQRASPLASLEDMLQGLDEIDSLSSTLLTQLSSSFSTPADPSSLPVAPEPEVGVNLDYLETLHRLLQALVSNQYQQSYTYTHLHSAIQHLQERLQNYRQGLLTLQTEAQIAPHQGEALDPALILQQLLDETVRLGEAADAVELFGRETGFTVEKQQLLLARTETTLKDTRMLPLRQLFRSCWQELQPLSASLDKPVRLQWSGEDELLDRAIAERLADPLLQLLRYVLVYSLESPEARLQQGKTREGLIELRAQQQGNRLFLEIWDDSQRIDRDWIQAQALTSGLLTSEQEGQLSESDLMNLLFTPDLYSPQQTPPEVGVSLEQVRTEIQTLQGSVHVDLEPQQGTHFLIQIPLQLAWVPLLICQVQGRPWALLTESVTQILLPRPHHLHQVNGHRVLRWTVVGQERLIPILRLQDLLADPEPHAVVSRDRPTMPPLILFQNGQSFFALEVEELIGEQELVTRPLSPFFTAPAFVHGCSVLSHGQLALVIDAVDLIERHLQADTIPPPLPAEPLPPAILVVDDSITVQQHLSRILKQAGYPVCLVSDGQEALAQLRQRPIQLVVCDLEMPYMDGFELLRQKQQDPDLREIPVVMLTSHSGATERQRALDLGASAYLTKPCQDPKLLQTIATVLETVSPSMAP
jgi:chemotaxis family two-component system sensor histidine kinase/response regulator PixL